MLTPPYGVFFIPPPGWEDVTYYRFRQVTEKRDFVIEEQEWDQGDPEGWLVRARERLQQLGVSPIVSAPHSEFVVRGSSVWGKLRARSPRCGCSRFPMTVNSERWRYRVPRRKRISRLCSRL